MLAEIRTFAEKSSLVAMAAVGCRTAGLLIGVYMAFFSPAHEVLLLDAATASTSVVSRQDELDISRAIEAYLSGRRPDVSLVVNREETGTARPHACVTGNYKISFGVEQPFVGYIAWLAWAVKNGVVERRPVKLADGSPTVCPFAVEHKLLTDYRVMWDDRAGLRIWLVGSSEAHTRKYELSTIAVAGAANALVIDLELDVGGKAQWPGISITPSAVPSTIRLMRDPRTGRMEVVKADIHWPRISLVQW
jgi:hypothetical protein